MVSKQLPATRELAKSRGVARRALAKMTGPDMRESPGGNPLIVWNQPHMVHLCELLYRNNRRPDIEPVSGNWFLETAECWLRWFTYDEAKKVLSSGPTVVDRTQEIYDQGTSESVL